MKQGNLSDNVLMRIAARWNMPFILVFALYTQTHGELGPGGGFQAGVMIAAAFILYGLVFGADEMRRIVPRWVSDAIAALGVLIYAGAGMYCMLIGYEILDYAALYPSNPGGAEPWGMTTVEYGVGLTVSAVMLTVYNEITEGTGPGSAEPREGNNDTEVVGKV